MLKYIKGLFTLITGINSLNNLKKEITMSSSGLNNPPKYSKYTGTGVATAQAFNLGYRPYKVEIKSVEGVAVIHDRMPGAWHAVNGAAAALLGATELEITDTGFSIASTDDVINKASTEYYYEAY